MLWRPAWSRARARRRRSSRASPTTMWRTARSGGWSDRRTSRPRSHSSLRRTPRGSPARRWWWTVDSPRGVTTSRGGRSDDEEQPMGRVSGREVRAGAMDPVTLEVVRNRLDVIAAEMESALIRSAFSVVIKEGADCSCALFTATGDTMAQSVALPQHLGVLAATVKTVLREYPVETMTEGDVYIMNDPYDGGTHIPDINILAP